MAETKVVEIELPVQRTDKHSGEVSKLTLHLETGRVNGGGVGSEHGLAGSTLMGSSRLQSDGRVIFTSPFSAARSLVLRRRRSMLSMLRFLQTRLLMRSREVLDYYKVVQLDWFTHDFSAC